MTFDSGKEIPTGVKENLPLLDPVMAKEGVANFGQIAKVLSPVLKEAFLKNQKIKACFIGTRPEIGDAHKTFLDTLSLEQREKVTSTFMDVSDNFLVLSYPSYIQDMKQFFSIINIRAAVHVLKAYQQYFPSEAIQDPRKWFITNIHDWNRLRPISDISLDIVDMRYGLLSGIPVNATLKYRPYLRARSKLDTGKLSGEEISFFNLFHSMGKLPRTKENITRLSSLADRCGDGLNEEEKELIIQKRIVPHRPGHPGYIAFNQKDVDYGQQVEEFYHQIGIDQVEAELQTKAA